MTTLKNITAPKWYLPDADISKLSAMAEMILPADHFSKLKKIAKKYGLALNTASRINQQTFWAMVMSKLNDLPADDNFRKQCTENNTWQNRNSDYTLVFEYMKHADFWKEYEFLCLPAWKAFETFTSNLMDYGLPNTGLKSFIDQDGSYKDYFQQYSKSNCDKRALELSKSILKTLEDSLVQELNSVERFNLGSAIFDYCKQADPEALNIDTLHQKIFKTF